MLNISEAGALAMHATVYIASADGRKISTKELAGQLSASRAHLSKVLQRLARYDLVDSTPGPGGGFVLCKPAEEVSLLDVYEAAEGPFERKDCLFAESVCDGGECIFGGLLGNIDEQMKERLETKNLAELTGTFSAARKKAE